MIRIGGRGKGGRMWNRILNEPVLVGAVLVALVHLASSFGLEITDDQQLALDAVVGAVVALLVRARVTPVRKLGRGPHG